MFRNNKYTMKNTINKEEAAGVLQSSITSVSCMFPSIFTKDDVIRLLNEVQEKIEALPSEQAQPVLTQVSGTYGCAIPNVSASNNSSSVDLKKIIDWRGLATAIRDSIDDHFMNADFSGIETDIELETEDYGGGEIKITSSLNTSDLSSSIYSEIDFDTIEDELRETIDLFVEGEKEKVQTSNNQN